MKNIQDNIASVLNRISNELNKFTFELDDSMQIRNIFDKLSLTGRRLHIYCTVDSFTLLS